MINKNNRDTVTFLNPRTCGIYKNGGTRFKTDSTTGLRTDEVDNELLEYVGAFLLGEKTIGESRVPITDIFQNNVLVPTYYDNRYNESIDALFTEQNVSGITIGQLLDSGIISVRGGHGSPGNYRFDPIHQGF